jgi:hypothetical protein
VISNTTALVYAGITLAGVVGILAASLWAGHEHRTTPAPPPRPAIAAPAAYLPCHTTTCGHMSTPHDHTAAGLTCRACGTHVPATEG